MIPKVYMIFYIFSVFAIASELNCQLPKNISGLENVAMQKKLFKNNDIKRNAKSLKSMCVHSLSFQEGKYLWEMILIYNPNKKNGPFWFLPHDDENTAFDSAVYSTKKYGGGFLAIDSSDHRYFNGQDPNRNFGESRQTASSCQKQNYPAPAYCDTIFKVIDTFRKKGMPYLAMHNNKNGWYGNGGSGGISIFKKSSTVHSYQTQNVLSGKRKGIRDEDSLVYIAGTGMTPPSSKLKPLMSAGMNVKYEVVNTKNNDCSMSNYVVLKKRGNYYNIETEHGDSLAQKRMIDKLMKILRTSPSSSPEKKFKLNLF